MLSPTRTMTAWQTAISKGLAASKRNRWPALAMWVFAASLIGCFYFVPMVRHALERVGDLKTEWGWAFSMISTGIFGGLIPALLPSLLRHPGAKLTLGLVVSSTLLWAYKGIETDYFYRFQGWLFGTDSNLMTIITKTLCDQFIWVPIWGLVNVVLFYIWRDAGYSLAKTQQRLGPGWYWRRVLPVLIANWVVWVPAVAMVYSLPSALQIPVQNLILCFWVLVLTFFTEPEVE